MNAVAFPRLTCSAEWTGASLPTSFTKCPLLIRLPPHQSLSIYTRLRHGSLVLSFRIFRRVESALVVRSYAGRGAQINDLFLSEIYVEAFSCALFAIPLSVSGFGPK